MRLCEERGADAGAARAGAGATPSAAAVAAAAVAAVSAAVSALFLICAGHSFGVMTIALRLSEERDARLPVGIGRGLSPTTPPDAVTGARVGVAAAATEEEAELSASSLSPPLR